MDQEILEAALETLKLRKHKLTSKITEVMGMLGRQPDDVRIALQSAKIARREQKQEETLSDHQWVEVQDVVSTLANNLKNGALAKKRVRSAQALRNIKLGQQKRRAAEKARKTFFPDQLEPAPAPETPAKKKRVLSPEGLAAIKKAQKKRWAADAPASPPKRDGHRRS